MIGVPRRDQHRIEAKATSTLRDRTWVAVRHSVTYAEAALGPR